MQDEIITSQTLPTTVIIAGLGKEGESSFRYLRQRFPGATFILSDSKSPDQLEEVWRTWLSEEHTRFVALDQLPNEQLEYGSCLLSKTPGIPAEHPALRHLLSSGVKLTSNTACFFEEITQLPDVETIAVTGSKGKSTTSSLIAHVLQKGSRPVFFAGNIGSPPLSVLDGVRAAAQEEKKPIVVLELSSHQLRESSISPSIAVLLDVTPEHLDYYPSFTAYWQAKAAITTLQTPTDYLLFNPSHPIPAQIATLTQAQLVTMGNLTSYDAWFDSEYLHAGEWQIKRSNNPLLGEHNAFNALPALWIAKHFGLDQQTVEEALSFFEPLPHRLQPAGTVNGVSYINDSQATTPEATIAALRAFPEKNITLIVGGSDKGVSFAELAQAILDLNVQTVLLFPPMGEAIHQAVVSTAGSTASMSAAGAQQTRLPTFFSVESMQEAVHKAAEVAPPGGVVLLSPACASFGLFKNYQDRGNQFLEAVAKL